MESIMCIDGDLQYSGILVIFQLYRDMVKTGGKNHKQKKNMNK